MNGIEQVTPIEKAHRQYRPALSFSPAPRPRRAVLTDPSDEDAYANAVARHSEHGDRYAARNGGGCLHPVCKAAYEPLASEQPDIPKTQSPYQPVNTGGTDPESEASRMRRHGMPISSYSTEDREILEASVSKHLVAYDAPQPEVLDQIAWEQQAHANGPVLSLTPTGDGFLRVKGWPLHTTTVVRRINGQLVSRRRRGLPFDYNRCRQMYLDAWTRFNPETPLTKRALDSLKNDAVTAIPLFRRLRTRRTLRGSISDAATQQFYDAVDHDHVPLSFYVHKIHGVLDDADPLIVYTALGLNGFADRVALSEDGRISINAYPEEIEESLARFADECGYHRRIRWTHRGHPASPKCTMHSMTTYAGPEVLGL